MRILVVAPQPFLTPRGTPFSVYYRALVLAEQGTEVDLLSYGPGQDIDVPGVRVCRIPRVRWLEPVPVGPSWRKALLDVLMVLWTIGLLLRSRYDAVDAHEEAVFWCRFLKPLFRFRLIYEMHSSLPQQLANFQFTKSRVLTGLFRRLEATSLRAADAVVTVCPSLDQLVAAKGVPQERRLMIENSLFEEVRLRTAPAARGDVVTSLTDLLPSNGRVVLYAGTFETYQGIELLVDAFARVAGSIPDAHLTLVGGSAEQVARVKARLDSHGLDGRCRVSGQVPKQVASRLMLRADVLVSPRLHGTNTPLKIYEQLASGRPLVATRIEAHTQVLDDFVCWLAEPNAAAMSAALVAALTQREASAARVSRAVDLYRRRYSRPAYEDGIRRLLGIVA